MAKTITVIPSTINPLTRLARTDIRKRRTAGYARVSTDSDEQFTSYEAQIDYYTKYITSHQDSAAEKASDAITVDTVFWQRKSYVVTAGIITV